MAQENQNRIFTCKPNEFDLVSVFEKYDKVMWIKYYNKAIVGDTIYFYVGGEHQRIMYKCIIESIISADSDDDLYEEYAYTEYWKTPEMAEEKNKDAEAYYAIKLLQKLDFEELTYSNFMKVGLIASSIQGKLTEEVNPEIFEYIKSFTEVNTGVFDSWEIINRNIAIKSR